MALITGEAVEQSPEPAADPQCSTEEEPTLASDTAPSPTRPDHDAVPTTTAAPPPQATLRQRKPPSASIDAAETAPPSSVPPQQPGDDAEERAPTEAEKLLQGDTLNQPSFAAAVNAALHTTAGFRCAADLLTALAALRSATLPNTVTPVLLLMAMNIAIIVSTALFYVGSLADFRAAMKQRSLRLDNSGGGVLMTLLGAVGLARTVEVMKMLMAMLYALYIDSSVYLASVISLHLAMGWLGV